jgi:antirestriction protein ArdC
MTNLQKSSPIDVYAIVTNRIIENLEKGIIPWQQPWADAGLPKNLITGKNYRGINVWLLASLHYPRNYFLTFKQVQDLGALVKKGEKSQEVIFWKWLEKEVKGKDAETEKTKRVPMLRYYRVFNIDQCEGIPKEKVPPIIERKNDPIESCEKIITEMPKRPEIRHNEQQAYYNKVSDFVNMPKMETFENSEGYYGTLFHELVHSTGHTDRLNRREIIQNKGFRTENYAVEELTAEMGASYLKSYAGIPIEQLKNNIAYIQNWLERLRNDKRFIVHASAQAQKATDFILNVRNEEKEVEFIDQSDEPNKNLYREEELKKTRETKKEKRIEIEKQFFSANHAVRYLCI